MAAKEIYDYLSTVSADVDVTLSISCQVEIVETGYKDQVIHMSANGSPERKGFSEDAIAIFRIQYNVLSASDAGTIFDIYHDSAKANAFENSFKFNHPDGHTYVVKFSTRLPREFLPTHHGYKEIDLIVIGRIAD